MIVCEICKACYPDHWQQPIRCSHKFPGRDFSQPRQRTKQVHVTRAKINPWLIIHDRWGACVAENRWDKHIERDWYNTTWKPNIPKQGCGCDDHWARLTLTSPIDFSTAEAAFCSMWHLHNEVSLNHSHRPTITYDEALSLYVAQPELPCVAVTSLSPTRIDRQTECLESWRRFGLRNIVAFVDNTSLVAQFPQVTTWVICEDRPKIYDMLTHEVLGDSTRVIINSDIEFRGRQTLIRDDLQQGLIGIRFNYQGDWWRSTRESWGVDLFSFTREQAASLPPTDFRIGKPWWDYWLLEHTREDGRRWILEPLLFHRSHETAWSESDWDLYGAEFARLYGRSYGRGEVREFRAQFPAA